MDHPDEKSSTGRKGKSNLNFKTCYVGHEICNDSYMVYLRKHIMVFVAMLTLLFGLGVLCHDAGGQQNVTESNDTSLAILKTDPVGYPPPISIESRSQVSHLFFVKKRVPARIAALTGFSTGRLLLVKSFTPSVREFIPQVSILKRISVLRI